MEELLKEFIRATDEKVSLIGDFEDVAIVRHKYTNRWAMIFRDCGNNEKWRVQKFDEDGFIGHFIYSTKAESVRTLAQENMIYRDDEALDRLNATGRFLAGNDIACIRQQLNSGDISFTEYLEQARKVRSRFNL